MNPQIFALHIAYARYCTYHMTTKLLINELSGNLIKTPQCQKEDNQKIILYTTRSYLSLDYALLYVVIEGYKDSKLKDPHLDQLLKEDDKLDKLKSLRLSVFYPKEPNKYVENLLNFLEIPGSKRWIAEVDRAFSKFFMADPIVKEKIKQHAFSGKLVI